MNKNKIVVHTWKYSTFGELLSSDLMKDVMKNPDKYDFDVEYDSNCRDGFTDPPRLVLTKQK